MSQTILNRRNLLKTGLIFSAGFAITPSASASELMCFSLDEPKPGVARLSSNENPYGPSPMARKAMMNAVQYGNRYGFESLNDLRKAIANKEDVPEDHIMIAAGSTELLLMTGMYFAQKGGNIISADPAFATMMSQAEKFGMQWKKIPLNADHAHDLEKMAAAVDAETRVIYVCNPNNPTGSLTNFDKLLSFCSEQSSKVPVFADEAYLEFLEPDQQRSLVSLVKEGKDVMVARTFSKIHGMAGMRLGYLIAKPEWIRTLQKYQLPVLSSISSVGLAGALASMQDFDFHKSTREWNKKTLDFTSKAIQNLGYTFVPSYTNFIIFPIKTAGKEFQQKMSDKNVSIRTPEYKGQPHCRVSMGTMPEMEQFAKALKEIS